MVAKDRILRVKPAMVLLNLKNDGRRWYISNLAREAGLSYVYATNLLKELEREGIVSFRKMGKIKQVMLTEKGLQIASALGELMDRLDEEKRS